MLDFIYKNQKLTCCDIPLGEIIAKTPTPFYLYSEKSIINQITLYRELSSKYLPKAKSINIAYALKANDRIALLKIISKQECGGDIVSANELQKALLAGIKAENIVFSGIGKTYEELNIAVHSQLGHIIIESWDELNTLSLIAQSNAIKTNILFRYTPDITINSHHGISTGKAQDKFGLSTEKIISFFNKCKDMNFINPCGVSVHIGSQINNLEPYEKCFKKLKEFYLHCKELGFNFSTIDFGGGINPKPIDIFDNLNLQSTINYSPKNIFLETYFKLIKTFFNDFTGNIIFEPGRFIIANSGVLITKVIRVKTNKYNNFLITDAGMNNFLRPSLYNSLHPIWPVKIENHQKINYTIVGPICESTDNFGRYYLPEIYKNNFLAIMQTGAYGTTMANSYNSTNLASEVLIHNKQWKIIRSNISPIDLLKYENYT